MATRRTSIVRNIWDVTDITDIPGYDESFFSGSPDPGIVYHEKLVFMKDGMVLVQTQADVDAMVEEVASAEFLEFDTETTGLDRDRRIVGFSIATSSTRGWYVPIAHYERGTVEFKGFQFRFYDNVENPRLALSKSFDALKRAPFIVVHNAKFDIATLRLEGLPVHELKDVRDSMLLAFLLGEPVLGLKQLVQTRLKYTMRPFSSFEKRYKKQAKYVPIGDMASYAIEDVTKLHDLWLKFYKALNKLPPKDAGRLTKIYRELELPIMRLLEEMEDNGFLVDTEELNRLTVELLALEHAETGAISQLLGLSEKEMKLGSTQWLSALMIDKLRAWGPPPEGRGKNGAYSTAVGNIDKWKAGTLKGTSAMGKQVAEHLVRLRQAGKLRSTYTEALVEKLVDGRVHCSFNQTGARTGRFSSSDPNLQNIPAGRVDWLPQVRRAFIADREAGYELVVVDYSQIELRLLAHNCQDPRMLQVYRENGDIHQMTADGCGCERWQAKGINFGLIYGMGPKKLAVSLGISEVAARQYWQNYFEFYDRVRPYNERVIKFAQTHGYVETIIGRRRWLDDIYSDDQGLAAQAGRQAVNTTIQGSASDLIKLAMRNMHREATRREWLGPNREDRKFRFTSQVHDELLFEVHRDILDEALPVIQYNMENALKLTVPLIAIPKVAVNWQEAK